MLGEIRGLAGAALDGLASQYPAFRELRSGRIAVPEHLVEEQLQKQAGKREEIESLSFTCFDGYCEIGVKTLKNGARHAITIPVEVEEFILAREKQRAVLLFPGTPTVDSENMTGWLTRGLAASMLRRMLGSGENAQEIGEKTKGIVEIDWPRAYLHLHRHEQLRKYLFERIGPLPSLLDIFEVRECILEPGQIVLPVRRRR